MLWRRVLAGVLLRESRCGAVLVHLLWRALPVCAPWCPPLRPLPLCHGPRPFLICPLGGFLPPCCVSPGALSLWAPACYLGHLLAALLRAFPLPLTFPVFWWWARGGVSGAPKAHA